MSPSMVVGVLVLLLASNAWAVLSGRRSTTATHRRAFRWGVVALCGIPLWLLTVGGLVLGAFSENGTSAPVLFLLASLFVLAASGVAFVSAWLARSGNRPG